MAPLTRAEHLVNLRREFPSVSTLKETPAELVLKVDHKVTISTNTDYYLTLYVKLLSTFPKTPPAVTMPYTTSTVPITPPNINPTEAAAYQWDSEGSSLVEAIRNAFLTVADRWGPVPPPTLEAVALQLSGETDRLLHDLVANPNCLAAYCYQLPVVKQMRDVSRQTVNEVEKVANENVRLRPAVEDLEAEVRRLQTQLQQQVEALRRAGDTPLLNAICTPEALIKTLEADARTLYGECRKLGKQALMSYKTDKRAYQDAMAEFKAKAAQMHLVDMKARAFRAQM